MAKIKGRNTSPEKTVRRCLRKLGVHYRSHARRLPGTPDFILPDLETALFVNGCFWHGHKDCRRASIPSSNTIFWKKKIAGNITRDKKKARELRSLGWHVETIWQCQMKNEETVLRKVSMIREQRSSYGRKR
jgi:DNA mismatch endonuclease (patch repair protein)